MSAPTPTRSRSLLDPKLATALAMFLFSFGLVLYELLLTRLFAVVLFASFAHLALGLALLGISVGALLQHLWPSLLPDDGLEDRLAAIAIGMCATVLGAVGFTIRAPVTVQWDAAPADFAERSTLTWDLIDPVWFGLLLPVLAVPFALAGLAFAGAFQRRKAAIGLLYGADLIGGAAAAVAFVPLLYTVPGPDAVFVVVLAGAIAAAALWASIGRRGPAIAALLPAVASVALLGAAVARDGVLQVRYAAGYSEDNVTYTRWTPLTRLAIHEDARGHFMLLDNTSASEIVRSDARRKALALEPNRGLVYQLHHPPAKVAILAASAGPEVAVAQSFGFTGIDAIDIAPEIGDVVAERYADNPVNPYATGDTHRILLDGRAAILHADHPYDIIQMVHANLHSSAGLLANAWSPALLETREAFELYLTRLTPDGTLSFGRGPKTKAMLRTVMAAMTALGMEHPERNVICVSGPATVMLAKPRAWTQAERDEVARIAATRPGQFVWYDPLAPRDRKVWDEIQRAPLITDDRPYFESPRQAGNALLDAFGHFFRAGDEQVEAVTVLYHALALQTLFVLAVGVLSVAVPALRRAPSGLDRIDGAAIGLAYVSCLGYGYLAIETVLIHDLVLFVGHPTYAITVVILAMLLFSGVGSILAGRVAEPRLVATLRAGLVGVLALGALQAFAVPVVLDEVALGWPIGVRAAIVFVVLAPLGLVMGLPFPLALRILRPEAAAIVPWAWALNGWTSVVASIGTVVLSRLVGYDFAFLVALAAYGAAAVLASYLPRIGARAESVAAVAEPTAPAPS